MQSEPNEISQKDSLHSNNPDTSQTSQYGFLHHAQEPSLRPSAGQGGIAPRSPIPHRPTSDTSSEASENSLPGLSATKARKKSPADRISEHEKASTRPPRNNRRAPAFTVVQRSTRKGPRETGIVDFPNEVLTHILSHLPPSSFSSVALVSKRFHELVTTPHAWRSAFSRFFTGSEAIATFESKAEHVEENESLYADRRFFTRLTALASWRSEYILRTRLLRSLARGKPVDVIPSGASPSSKTNVGQAVNAQVTYSSNLTCPANHIHSSFGTSLNRPFPRFVHGSSEIGMASTSDPRLGKADNWGFQDNVSFNHFSDLFPGEAQYGLGTGDFIGVPNCIDVSQPFGVVYGEGHESDSVLWFRHTEEKRGRALARSNFLREPANGLPLLPDEEAICSVWISKSRNLPDLSEGLIGILAGSSTGVLTAYSLGTNGVVDRRLERGEITARWVVSPGVPLIAISIDQHLSAKRLQARRIWATVLNALGEVYYLTDLPVVATQDLAQSHSYSPRTQPHLERLAWATGRTVQWKLAEPTRRVARVDPFSTSEIDGSYSPQASSHYMHLSRDQLVAETNEVENFLHKKAKHFRKVCHGWDMRRRLEVDFAAAGKYNAGEVVVVMSCALEEESPSQIKRYIRSKIEDRTRKLSNTNESATVTYTECNESSRQIAASSIFGGHSVSTAGAPSWSFAGVSPVRRRSFSDSEPGSDKSIVEEWRTTELSFGDLRPPQITSSALDMSAYATLTTFEDPLISMSGSSGVSGLMSSPLASMDGNDSRSDIPGHRARLLAVGTNNGIVLVYNLRSAEPTNAITENSTKPLRIIHTDSPQISCLALTALYLVHGGNDGLVQAWDPLASTIEPIRTLNSRFSSRARRRLVQAAASPAGVGINLFAAGAICLDPDPTVLRGMVSLGAHLRYWGYSSNGADQYKGNKRRLRRAERSGNQGADRFSGTGRGALKDFIANEKLDLEREKRDRRKEDERLAGRFGIDLLGPGASEDEIMAYATMLSEEAAESDELRRKSASSSEATSSPVQSQTYLDSSEQFAEATQSNLEGTPWDADAVPWDLPVKYTSKNRPTPSTKSPVTFPAESDDDLEYAMQLSLAEQESKALPSKGKEREH